MRNLNEEEGNKLEDNFYNTRKYLSTIITDKENFQENKMFMEGIFERINYDIGVPLECLYQSNITDFGKLVEICEQNRKSPSEYQKDLDDRISYLISLNLSKPNIA